MAVSGESGRVPAAVEETTVEGVTGTKIDQITVEIDYAIIQHFSQHLYSSPNKAIEELVSNSFDALATVPARAAVSPEAAVPAATPAPAPAATPAASAAAWPGLRRAHRAAR